jgi:predicted ArsR family transcriptional regulator
METTTRHRALADARRVRIVEELRDSEDGLDAHELGRRVGLHANTVRWHLSILADAGLVGSAPAVRATRGRPRILYSLEPEPAEQRTDEHRLLATVLTGALAASDDGPVRAEEAGEAWGRYLLARDPLARPADDDAAIEEVVDLLDQQGFEPSAQECEIHMARCPFHALADSQPEVVCAVHKGLISGALSALGSDFEVEGLEVFVRPDLCVARLRRSARAGARTGRPRGSQPSSRAR